jgi:hypothetical protein
MADGGSSSCLARVHHPLSTGEGGCIPCSHAATTVAIHDGVLTHHHEL